MRTRNEKNDTLIKCGDIVRRFQHPKFAEKQKKIIYQYLDNGIDANMLTDVYDIVVDCKRKDVLGNTTATTAKCIPTGEKDVKNSEADHAPPQERPWYWFLLIDKFEVKHNDTPVDLDLLMMGPERHTRSWSRTGANKTYLPPSQIPILSSSESRYALQAWLNTTSSKVDRNLSKEQRDAIRQYAGNGYAIAWQFTRKYGASGPPANVFDTAPWFRWVPNLLSAFTAAQSTAMPIGTRLYEGRGTNEVDGEQLLTLTVGQSMTVRRPISTSWHPNVALEFVGPMDQKGSVLVIYDNVYKELTALPLEQMSASPHEAEILLPPFLVIQLMHVTTMTLDRVDTVRIASVRQPKSYRVCFVHILGSDRSI